MPSRLRTASMSSSDHASVSEDWQHSRFSTQDNVGTPATSIGSTDLRRLHESQKLDTDTAITCLLADDNPISLKILETLLTRMGCRCVLVADGAEAISVALGDISKPRQKF
jgi:serine/threonine-protein kinase RIM15